MPNEAKMLLWLLWWRKTFILARSKVSCEHSHTSGCLQLKLLKIRLILCYTLQTLGSMYAWDSVCLHVHTVYTLHVLHYYEVYSLTLPYSNFDLWGVETFYIGPQVAVQNVYQHRFENHFGSMSIAVSVHVPRSQAPPTFLRTYVRTYVCTYARVYAHMHTYVLRVYGTRYTYMYTYVHARARTRA